MSDQKPPPSITEAILANPASFLTPEQRQDGPPTPQQDGEAVADAKDAGATLKAWLQGQPVPVGEERFGQLAPPHSPTIRDAGGGQPSGWVRARHPADSPPPSITESILRDPGRYLPPEPAPAPGHDRDPGREQ